MSSEWSRHISHSYNRVYISPASGCDTDCVYCFIFEYGHPRKPALCNIPIAQIRDWILTQKWFRKGRNGTLISLAPACDPFAPEVVEKTLEFVDGLATLENPIQVSTKRHIDPETAKRISLSQAIPGQIVIYVTITSFSQWDVLEPGSVEPNLRLKGLANAQNLGVSTCLYIKPVLPGITERESESFVRVIGEYQIPYCVVGILYASDAILRRMKQRNLVADELQTHLNSKGTIPPPGHLDGSLDIGNLANLSTVHKILNQVKTTEAECVIAGTCVMALSYDILSPTGIWLYRPHLCVECEAKCRSKFAEAPADVREAFPHDNPLPQ